MIINKNKNNRNILITGIILFIFLLFVVITSIRVELSKKEAKISFEAESTHSISSPMEIIDEIDVSGGKCLEIKQGMGTGMYGTGGGQAVYKIDIPEGGNYLLWARTYWLDGCSNSFYVRISNRMYHFGEDSYYNAWHWVKKEVALRESAEKENMIIINREDGIKIDKFILTKDRSFIPQGYGGGMQITDFNDASYEDWSTKTETRWEIKNGQGMDGSPAFYLNSAEAPVNEYSISNVYTGDTFIFRCLTRCIHYDMDKRNVQLIFDYIDDKNYSYVNFQNGFVSVRNVDKGMENVICNSEKSIRSKFQFDNKYHSLELIRNTESLLVKFDGIPSVCVETSGYNSGKIGIGSLFGSVYFDNIVIEEKPDINFAENFYYDLETPIAMIKAWQPVMGKWVRNEYDGTLAYEVESNKLAVSLTGNGLWNNYRYDVAAKAAGANGIGMVFYYINNENYYLFLWGGKLSIKRFQNKKQLIKVVDGKPIILAEEDGGYDEDQWYRMRVEVLDGHIQTFIDDEIVFDVIDRSLFQGRIGLWIDGREPEKTEYTRVHLWPGIYSGESWEQSFIFGLDKGNSGPGIYYCYQDNNNYYLLRPKRKSSESSKEMIQLIQVKNGVESVLEEKNDIRSQKDVFSGSVSKIENTIVLKLGEQRGMGIGDVKMQEKMRFEIENPIFRDGRLGFNSGRYVNGVFDDVKVESINDFYSDFSMEEQTKPIRWTQIKGSWFVENHAYTASPGSLACTVTGELDWDDYMIKAKIKPGTSEYGKSGMYFYYNDDDNYYLFRHNRNENNTRRELVKVIGGETTILDEDVKDQNGDNWSDIKIETDDGWIGIYENNELVFNSYDWDLKSGKMGLYSDDLSHVYFDDVHVKFGKIQNQLVRLRSIFTPKVGIEVSETNIYGWTVVGGQWNLENGTILLNDKDNGTFLWRNDERYYEDVTVVCDAWSSSPGGVEAGAIIGNKKRKENSGYKFSFSEGGIEFSRDEVIISKYDSPVMEQEKVYRLRFEKRRGYILGYINDKCVLEYKENDPLSGGDVALFAKKGAVGYDNIIVSTYPLHYYNFSLADFAATDFSHWRVESGIWDDLYLVYRMYGEKDSKSDAIIWHKNPLPEEMAVSMAFNPLFYSKQGEVLLSICSDGKKITSGYTFHFFYFISEESEDSQSNTVTVNLKKGDKIVDRGGITLPDPEENVRIRIERIENIVKLYIAGNEIIEYRDDSPPQGNMFALGVAGDLAKPVFFNDIAIYSKK